VKRFAVLALVFLSQLSVASLIDRSTPEQKALREAMAKQVDAFVGEAFKNIQNWQDYADGKKKNPVIALFEDTIDGLTKSGFQRYSHYSVYIGNPGWHDEETSFETPKYYSLQDLYEGSPLRSHEPNQLNLLRGREGKFVVITKLYKNLDAQGTYYYEGETRLTIRYNRIYDEAVKQDVLYLTPALVETSFRHGTSLEGNGSSAGGPR